MIEAELNGALRRELLAGERILWSGRSDPRRMRAVFLIWLFAIPWTAFALFWEAAALLPWFGSSQTPDGIRLTFGIIFPLFGLPFVAVGFAMMAAPFVMLRKAARTIYGLTDRRILKLTSGSRREVKSVSFEQMGSIEVKADTDGFGDLHIETGSHFDSDGDRVTDRFEVSSVPDVARLERLLLERRTAREVP